MMLTNLRAYNSTLRFALASVAMALIFVVMPGCGGGASTTARMYTLRLPDPPATPVKSSTLTIGVEHFSAVTPLNDARILKYESPTQLKYYNEDHWVSEPTTMVSEFAARYLERKGIAQQASLLPWIEKMDYVLQGQILNFEEVVTGDQREARVALELTLLRFPNREVVWTGTFRARRSFDESSVPAAVEALSVATQDALQEGFTQLAGNLPRPLQAEREKASEPGGKIP